MFGLTLLVKLITVGARGLPLGGGVWFGPLLQKSLQEQQVVNNWPVLLNIQAWNISHFTRDRCMQYWQTAGRLYLFPAGGVSRACLKDGVLSCYLLYIRFPTLIMTQHNICKLT